MSAPKAYLEHVLGMTMREIDGMREAPRQYWTRGGLQFISAPRHEGTEGRLAYPGVMCEDIEAAIAAAQAFGVTELPQGRNWLRLPDGLVVELINEYNEGVAFDNTDVNTVELPDLKRLRLFDLLYDVCSVTRAAEQLG
ncbi:glyoxalase/bleomycin resistance protein/dioxygenase [Burkholderia anthina]|uniref:Glyoxalase/bleomycin resistance protein/dioxygenase n=1 Tax=Burkholderia anthina TaxID=179879 RepID=A0A6P2G719_9BURK|nr:glyoxalase/bleomycin resistance protein/dioxygenase [Burkholderia anthina]